MTLVIEQLSKSYDRTPILENLTVSFAPGDVTLLLGANGAGKSTLLKLCAGLLRPSSGKILLDGKTKKFSDCGYFGHDSLLYRDLSARENLQFFASLTRSGESTEETLARWDITDIASKKVSELSKGQISRISLARAFSHSPGVLLLDEPTAALDEKGTCLLLEQLKSYQENSEGIVVIATHDVRRLSPHVNRVLVLNENRILEDTGKQDSENPISKAVEQYLSVNR